MPNDDFSSKTRRKSLKRKVRWGRMIAFLLVLSLLGIIAAGLISAVKYIFFSPPGNFAATIPHGKTADSEFLKNNINILVMGLDGQKGDGSDKPRRSDSILVCSFDVERKNVAFLSVPRDTRVRIPNKGMDKINHAYAYGGEMLARQVTADFLSMPVSYHVVLDTEAFMHIVDILGGIGVYVENDMDYEDPYQKLYIHIKKGYQKLDGENSIKYVRYRSDELGDVGRVLRQQKFMKAFCETLFSSNGLLKAAYLRPVFAEGVKTDISMSALFKMALSFKKYSKEGINFGMLPGEFETVDDVSYWITDPVDVMHELDKLGIKYLK